jgi:hypothetical protein
MRFSFAMSGASERPSAMAAAKSRGRSWYF